MDGVHTDLNVLLHHIYEFRKGLRNLVLYTGKIADRAAIEQRLRRGNIAFCIQEVNAKKMNVFFGNPACMEVVQRFVHKRLCELTPEEDFILGIMLGYDRIQQCVRLTQRAGLRPRNQASVFFAEEVRCSEL